jgi:proteic killer suppression protein
MIKSFRNKTTEQIYSKQTPKGFPPDVAFRARTKLLQLQTAAELTSLSVPPGNRLEALKGSRHGQYSIRINDQWRICFEWRDGDAWEVEVVDYH